MRRLVRAAVTAVLVATGALVVASPAQADTLICEQYGSTTIQGR